MQPKYLGLLSVRGLFAQAVLLSHLTAMLPSTDAIGSQTGVKYWFLSTVMYVTGNGTSVDVFFILSGFVLSLAFFRSTYSSYGAFITKRICRLYLPYLCAILAAILLCSIFRNGPAPHLSKWFSLTWTTPITLGLVLRHLAMIGNFNTLAFNSPIWYVVQEMRISIVFPLIMIPVMRWKTKPTVLLMLVLYWIPYGLGHFHPTTDVAGYASTTQYMALFMLGALIAKHRQFLTDAYVRASMRQKITLSLVALALFSYRLILPNVPIIHKPEIDNWSIYLSMIWMMVLLMASKVTIRTLSRKPLLFLGKISYSFYLYHCIVLYSLTYLLYGHTPLFVIWGLTWLASLGIAVVGHYFIEVPSGRLGHALAVRFRTLPTQEVTVAAK